MPSFLEVWNALIVLEEAVSENILHQVEITHRAMSWQNVLWAFSKDEQKYTGEKREEDKNQFGNLLLSRLMVCTGRAVI